MNVSAVDPSVVIGRSKYGGWVDASLLNVHGEVIDVFNHRGANRLLLRQQGYPVSSLDWGERGERLYPQQLAGHSSYLQVR